jgi:hypothetical protein
LRGRRHHLDDFLPGAPLVPFQSPFDLHGIGVWLIIAGVLLAFVCSWFQ